jgi:hypothetical protein
MKKEHRFRPHAHGPENRGMRVPLISVHDAGVVMVTMGVTQRESVASPEKLIARKVE